MASRAYVIQNHDKIISPFSYYLQPKTLLFHERSQKIRQQKLNDHIESNDYFGTLATVVDLVHQVLDESLRASITTQKESKAQLARIKKDLLYMQKHFKIVKK